MEVTAGVLQAAAQNAGLRDEQVKAQGAADVAAARGKTQGKECGETRIEVVELRKSHARLEAEVAELRKEMASRFEALEAAYPGRQALPHQIPTGTNKEIALAGSRAQSEVSRVTYS